MQVRTDHRSANCAVGAAAALSLVLIAAGPAWPQIAPPAAGVQSPSQQSVPNPPSSQPPPQAEPAPPAREESPGLINELGKLWDKSLSILPKIKSPSETLDDIKGAGESLTNLAKPCDHGDGARGLRGRGQRRAGLQGRRRPALPEQGLQGRQEPRHRLPPRNARRRPIIPGRKREPGDCRMENFVIKALCQ